MKYTKAAAELLFAIKDAVRRAEVGDRAEHLARVAGNMRVTKADIEAAILVAGEEFLPDEETE